jgi:HlyD family secretion protein
MNANYLATLPVAACMTLLLAACDDAGSDQLVVGQLASDRIELSAEVNEPIVEIAVAEGESVSKGQLLLRQDSARATASLAEFDAALDQARARLAELVRGPRREQISAARASAARAKQEFEFRETEYDRIKRVHERKLVADEALDQAKSSLDLARSDLDVRNSQLQEQLAGTTVEELEQAEAAVAQAVARRDSAAVNLERHRIFAPVDGIADTRLFEIGERPSPGQPVMIMLAGSQPYARVYVTEAMRVNVRPGTSATVHIDGLDQALAGRVRWVATESAFTPYFALTERDRGRLTYEAKIDLPHHEERLPDGIPVQVSFDTGDQRE